MKRLLLMMSLLIVSFSTFAQTFTMDGLTYSILSEPDKTVQLISADNAKGDVVVPSTVGVSPTVIEATWTTQSGPEWTTWTGENGHTVYKSGAIGHNESTVLRCTFRAKGSINFVCRYQGESNNDYLTVGDYDKSCTRSSYKATLKGSSGSWKTITINVPDENEHYVEFCYSKDGSVSTSPDCADVWIKDFEEAEYSIVSVSDKFTFKGNTSITSVTLSDHFTKVYKEMFRGCTALTSVFIPSSVTAIENSAFYDCTSLETVNYNAASVSDFTSGNYVFANAGKASNGITLNIGKDVKKIPAYFMRPYSSSTSYTPNLNNIVFDDDCSCTSIGNYAFYNCYSITSLAIPNSVTEIGNSAFQNCSGLTSVSIGNAVTSIGTSAFEDCSKITSITIPNSVTSVGDKAFRDCDGIESIVLGKNLSRIEENLFFGCGGIKEIHSLSITPPRCIAHDYYTTMGDYSSSAFLNFSGCDKQQVLLYVPKGSKDFYAKAGGWSAFLCIIEEGESEEVENLKAQIKTLEALNASLQSENTSLKTQITTLTTENAALKAELDEYSKKAVYDINGDKKVTITDVTTLIDVIVNQ